MIIQPPTKTAPASNPSYVAAADAEERHVSQTQPRRLFAAGRDIRKHKTVQRLLRDFIYITLSLHCIIS